ncbi:hypothetical protein CsSME_00049626 [Camellia sinensis var. sinensis]
MASKSNTPSETSSNLHYPLEFWYLTPCFCKWVLVKLTLLPESRPNQWVQTVVLLLQAFKVSGILHLIVSLGIILTMDKVLKKAFMAAAIKFPSALFGMFCVFTILMVLDSTVPAAATSLMNFFEPALLFIQRWLPLFYVPSLVVLPLAAGWLHFLLLVIQL